MTNRTFAVEIEVVRMNEAAAANALNEAGISAAEEGYNHRTRDYWKCVPDNSVRGDGGCEVVSPILRGEEGLRQASTVCKILREAGARVNINCGLHVHFGAQDLDTDQFQRISKRFVRDEYFMDMLVPTPRRRNNNTFSKSNVLYFPSREGYSEPVDGYIPGSWGQTSEWERYLEYTRCAWDRLDNSYDTEGVIRTMHGSLSRDNRYFKLNLTSFLRHGTLEFRQHSGTLNGSKLTNWVLFLDSLIFQALVKTPRMWNRENYTFPVGKAVHYLCLVAGCPNPVRNFWIKRAESLAADPDLVV